MLGLDKYQYKLTCVTHITSHNQSLYLAASFSVLARIKQHVSVELLELNHDYTGKGVH